MDEGLLRIREVDIVFQDTDYAYITGGLDTDAQVVITNLSTVVDGAPLRLEAEDTGDEDPLPAAAAPGSDAN
jgi:hypothetical protein